MNRHTELISRYRGTLFHAAGGLLVFALWRVAGMPAPGTLGRLIPLAWIITAIVYGNGRLHAASAWLLGVFVLLTPFWSSSPFMYILVSSGAMAALIPGLMVVSRTRMGILKALIPLVPIILVLVPFTGDEPHYARLTERIFPGGGDAFSSFQLQRGDTVEGVSHHQNLYPLLMLPGYPLGAPGLRLMNVLIALAAAVALSWLLRSSGYRRWRELAFLGFLVVPGSSILGLVYPGWLALAIFLMGVHLYLRSGRSVWIVASAVLLLLVKMRFVGLSAGILLVLLMETRGKRKWVLPAVLLGTAATGLLLDYAFLDGRLFWVRYGNAPFLKTVVLQPLFRYPELILSALSTLVDVESGLLWKAPWVLAALAGLPVLRRENRRLFRWLGLPAVLYVMFLLFWAGVNWSGMPTPAGRMLLPLMPVLIASLGKVLDRKGTLLLIWISLALSVLQLCHPMLRFNYADGTDALISLAAGPSSAIYGWLPSAVRVHLPSFAIWTLLSILVVWLIARRSRFSEQAIAICFGLICLAGGMPRTVWEAEDLPPSMMDFCSLYPAEAEPESRAYWFFSRERMLHLSGERDRVRIPTGSTPGDTVTVDIYYRAQGPDSAAGLLIECGEWSDSVFASSQVLEPPPWVTLIRDMNLDPRPENLSEISCRFLVPAIGDTLTISIVEGDSTNGGSRGIYLDRVTVR